MKKKIIIVDSNAKVGGIQKALVSLLRQINEIYDITVLLLNKKGTLINEFPKNVKVLETKSDFRYMGMSQSDCKTKIEKIRRGVYVLLCRILGRRFAVWCASLTLMRDSHEEYDAAISYSHIAGEKSFYSGGAEYVLKAFHAEKKICYIHCDYLSSGNRSEYSDRIYSRFDEIICVSESTRQKFIKALPALENKTHAIPNPIDDKMILELATKDTVEYDPQFVNIVSVARLSHEKGIARVIEILGKIDTSNLRYFVVGDGPERCHLEKRVAELQLQNIVSFKGEDVNPYRHMLNADLLIVPSYHEAAPVVFQEAKVLRLPVLTTRTTSADEMIGEKYGYVVDNNDEALCAKIIEILERPR